MPVRRPPIETAVTPSQPDRRDHQPEPTRHPASRAKNAQTRHPASQSTRSTMTARLDRAPRQATLRGLEHEGTPPLDALSAQQRQGREAARLRARARLRRVDLGQGASASGTSLSGSALGGSMHREALTLIDLSERQARLARAANKSEKTIAWYQGTLADFCRYLEGPGGVQAPARLSDFNVSYG